jgi:hypothetical protein
VQRRERFLLARQGVVQTKHADVFRPRG